jgi:hypothetical protein
MRDPLSPPNGQRHPYAVWTAGLCCLSGTFILFGGPQPTSLDSVLPRGFVFAWGFFLAAGGGVLLWGNLVRDRFVAMLLERAGSILLGGMCLVYSGAAFSYVGSLAAFPGSLAGALGVASLWRAWQIHSALRYVHSVLRQRAASDPGVDV